MPTAAKWPKTFPPLTAEQERIREDFVRVWHDELPKKYAVIERFNHGYVVDHAPEKFVTTLEVGAGIGEHLVHEKLTAEQRKNYVAFELRAHMANEIQKRHPGVQVVVGDCQERIAFPDRHFDRVLAVHVLEHLPNLPAAVREMHRVCKGVAQFVIPAEGGLAYSLARRVSAQRIFEKRYKTPYRWFIEREHVNVPAEIFEELGKYFTVVHRSFFPLVVPSVNMNVAIGITVRPT